MTLWDHPFQFYNTVGHVQQSHLHQLSLQWGGDINIWVHRTNGRSVWLNVQWNYEISEVEIREKTNDKKKLQWEMSTVQQEGTLQRR